MASFAQNSACLVVTGGGTAGHVLPNLAVISALKKCGWKILYLGTAGGIEDTIISRTDVQFVSLLSGKLHRRCTLKNLFTPFRVLFGLAQATVLLLRLRPHAVFSKGGYVALPVCVAAWLCRVPLIIHESDLSPGLGNRISCRFARRVCTTFDRTADYLPQCVRSRVSCTGLPVREELLRGDAESGRLICGFDSERPCLLVMGGSQGSERINKAIEGAWPVLIENFQIAHLTGKGKALRIGDHPRYRQFEFSEDVHHLLAMADLVLSRAGASSIMEILMARKLNILVPLGRQASRGEQIENARYFKEKGFSHVIPEEEFSPQHLVEAIFSVVRRQAQYLAAVKAAEIRDGTQSVCKVITEVIAEP